ncbi:MAG: cupredoxin domain-containing protein [Candidatus Colwellbacteria bacterium]|nr:cupredoxin domain-containing protein [Candidatus Colwellbacteria bacterium]
MSRNTYLVIGLVIILVILGFLLLQQRGGNEVLAPTGEEVSESTGGTGTESSQETGVSTGASIETGTGEAAVVTYTDNGFSPATLTVKKGETVTFKNNSGKSFWPASAVHPTHTVYPEFDAKQGIAPGAAYSFTFSRTGSWKYHNHLNPSLTGTITVQ